MDRKWHPRCEPYSTRLKALCGTEHLDISPFAVVQGDVIAFVVAEKPSRLFH